MVDIASIRFLGGLLNQLASGGATAFRGYNSDILDLTNNFMWALPLKTRSVKECWHLWISLISVHGTKLTVSFFPKSRGKHKKISMNVPDDPYLSRKIQLAPSESQSSPAGSTPTWDHLTKWCVWYRMEIPVNIWMIYDLHEFTQHPKRPVIFVDAETVVRRPFFCSASPAIISHGPGVSWLL